jgi:hypothetical protein
MCANDVGGTDAHNSAEEGVMNGSAIKDLCVLLYRSIETYEMDAADMLKLLIDARAHNHHGDITGLLLHHNGCFMQMLEGPRKQVHALYERIANDARHHDVVVEWDAHAHERLFPNWQMGFAQVPHIRGRAVMAGVESEHETVRILRLLAERHPLAQRMLDFLGVDARIDMTKD